MGMRLNIVNAEQLRKKATRRYRLFWFLAVIYCFSTNVYASYQQVINGKYTGMLSEYQLFCLGFCVLFFVPYTWRTYRYAKASNDEVLHKKVRKLFVYVSVWTVVFVLCTVLAVFFPQLFT